MISQRELRLKLFLFFSVLILSCIFMIVTYYEYTHIYGAPYYKGGGSDDWLYEIQAIQLGNTFWLYDKTKILETFGYLTHNSPGFVWFLSNFVAFVEVFTDYNTLHYRFFNCILLALSSVYYFKSVRSLKILSERRAFIVSLLGFVFPFVLYINSFVYRETLILFLMMWSLFHVCRVHSMLQRNVGLKVILSRSSYILALAVMAIGTLRLHYSIIVLLAVFCAIYFSVSGKKIGFFIKLIAVFLSLVALFYLYSKNYFHWIIFLVDGYSSYVTDKASGFSSIVFDQPFYLSAIFRILYSSIYPIPPISFDVHSLFMILGSTARLLLFPVVLWSVWRYKFEPRLIPFVVFFLCLYFGAVWGTFTYRHFMFFIVFFPLWASVALYGNKKYLRSHL